MVWCIPGPCLLRSELGARDTGILLEYDFIADIIITYHDFANFSPRGRYVWRIPAVDTVCEKI